jgi:hypothetical protein
MIQQEIAAEKRIVISTEDLLHLRHLPPGFLLKYGFFLQHMVPTMKIRKRVK